MADDNFFNKKNINKNNLEQINNSGSVPFQKNLSSQQFSTFQPKPSQIKEPIWTLDFLSKRVKSTISSIGRIAVEGEVSKFSISRGNWYIDLGDGKNTLKCLMFRNNNKMMEWAPKAGQKIRVSGLMDSYAPHSSYSLKVLRMEQSGVGDYAIWREQLRASLLAQGLFSQDRKRPLPEYPQAIGVATSATGAAITDIIKVLRERYPLTKVYVAPCTVQGDLAPQSIVNAIRLLNNHGKSDVLIVGRGGGSKESLRAFDTELVVRAVANSSIPIICSVGHESDNSLADLAADHRAATPSHAAERAVPNQKVLRQRLQQNKSMLDKEIKNKYISCTAKLKSIHLEDPKLKLSKNRTRLEQLQAQLHRSMNECFAQNLQKIQNCKETIQKADPSHKVAFLKQKLQIIQNKMETSVQKNYTRKQTLFHRNVSRLEDLNPLSILTRGYSIVQKSASSSDTLTRTATCVVNSRSLKKGDTVTLQFHQGKAKAKITSLTHIGDYEQTSLFDIE